MRTFGTQPGVGLRPGSKHIAGKDAGSRGTAPEGTR